MTHLIIVVVSLGSSSYSMRANVSSVILKELRLYIYFICIILFYPHDCFKILVLSYFQIKKTTDKRREIILQVHKPNVW